MSFLSELPRLPLAPADGSPFAFVEALTPERRDAWFGRLRKAGVRRVIDVRLNRSSQLAGFAKGGDLPFLLRSILAVDYVDEPLFAPTEDLVQLGRAKNWTAWESGVRRLMSQRRIGEQLKAEDIAGACLLCA